MSDIAKLLALMTVMLPLHMMPAAAAPTLKVEDLTEEELNEAVSFVIGNAVSVLFHESGHMLVSEFGLPVLGREEDAVDQLATVLLLEAGDESLDQMARDAADGWFMIDEKFNAEEDYAFWDEHSLDPQRAYAMACLMVGKDPEAFKDFADSSELPEERRERCASEYEQARSSWFNVLEPYARTSGDTAAMTVVYEEPASEDQKLAAELLKSGAVLDIVQTVFGEHYALEDGITLRAASCGQANAFWHPGDRQITYCYELVNLHMDLILGWLAEQREAGDDATAEGESEDETANATAAAAEEDDESE